MRNIPKLASHLKAASLDKVEVEGLGRRLTIVVREGADLFYNQSVVESKNLEPHDARHPQARRLVILYKGISRPGRPGLGGDHC
jgi:hypothetical protein